MYVTREEYAALEYSIIPQCELLKYERMAETTVRKYTQNRISDSDLRPPRNADDDTKRIAMMNQCGVCEIMDLYYLANNPQSEAAKALKTVTSFSNGSYSVSYLGDSASDRAQVRPPRMDIDAIMEVYFTADQLWRGFT